MPCSCLASLSTKRQPRNRSIQFVHTSDSPTAVAALTRKLSPFSPPFTVMLLVVVVTQSHLRWFDTHQATKPIVPRRCSYLSPAPPSPLFLAVLSCSIFQKIVAAIRFQNHSARLSVASSLRCVAGYLLLLLLVVPILALLLLLVARWLDGAFLGTPQIDRSTQVQQLPVSSLLPSHHMHATLSTLDIHGH